MEEYCAMVFDIKDSRSLTNRAEVQHLLIDSIKEFNQEHREKIKAPFLIILGDEWQGLLRSRDDYRMACEFFKAKLDLPFYVGVGVGPCTVIDEELTVNQMDGPAFYKARDALKIAKEKGVSEVLIH